MQSNQETGNTAACIHIPPELFLPAEDAQFQGEVVLPVMKFGPDLYTFSAPLVWDVHVTNTGEALLVEGTGEVTGQTACARCGDSVQVSLFGEIEGYFFLDDSDVSQEDKENDEFDILPKNHCIDLLPLIQAALALDIPSIPLCADDCKGLCSTCGANLNKGPCACQQDTRVNPNSPFAALKDFVVEEK